MLTPLHPPPRDATCQVMIDIRTCIEQYKLSSRIYLEASVRAVRALPTGWSVLGESGGALTLFQTSCLWAVLCTDRRLGTPRQIVVPKETNFEGEIRRGIGGDISDIIWTAKQVPTSPHISP